MGESRLPLLRARPEEVAERVLVVGDPGRAEQAAALLDRSRRVAANREYATYTGELGGTRLSVCSHGVGAAGAGVCFEELARAGATTIVRAGTCGAMRDDLTDGELVVATGAVRDEGLSPRLVPLAYPAVPDLELVLALAAAADRAGTACRRGVILTTDLFYPSKALPLDWRQWQSCNVIAVEMELSTLLIVAALHGIAAAGVFTVDGNPTRASEDMSDYDPYRAVVKEGTERMLRLSLEVLAGADRPTSTVGEGLAPSRPESEVPSEDEPESES